MTKVVELRDRVDRYKVGDYMEHDVEDGYATEDICVVHTDDLDSLISAAHALGVAEGAEQEREKWAGRACEYREGCLAFKTYFPTDPAVLAPTKEVAG